MRFAMLPLHLFKALRLPQKSEARSYEALHLSRKITLANLKIWCSKMQPLSGNQRPDLLTRQMDMSLVPRVPHNCIVWADPLRRSLVAFGNAGKLARLALFSIAPATKNGACPEACFYHGHVLRTTIACNFSTCQVPETLQGCGAFAMFTSKCASMLHASKSAPSMWCFVHFDFDMGFLPQPHGLCRRLNFQGCSEGFVFSTFFERASRHSCLRFFDISTSKGGPNPRSFCYFHFQCASRHNGMQFFLSHTTRWLRTRRFSEPTSGATKHWKKRSVSRLFYLFTHLPTSAFPSVHIVGSLTSKLHSIKETLKVERYFPDFYPHLFTEVDFVAGPAQVFASEANLLRWQKEMQKAWDVFIHRKASELAPRIASNHMFGLGAYVVVAWLLCSWVSPWNGTRREVIASRPLLWIP